MVHKSINKQRQYQQSMNNYKSQSNTLNNNQLPHQKKKKKQQKQIEKSEKKIDVAIEVLNEGDGINYPKEGQRVTVKYTGTLIDGTIFDETLRKPFSFKLGKGQVIKAWDIALSKFSLGQKAIVTVPPSLGYGSLGAPPKIPPNATLLFLIELVNIKQN